MELIWIFAGGLLVILGVLLGYAMGRSVEIKEKKTDG